MGDVEIGGAVLVEGARMGHVKFGVGEEGEALLVMSTMANSALRIDVRVEEESVVLPGAVRTVRGAAKRGVEAGVRIDVLPAVRLSAGEDAELGTGACVEGDAAALRGATWKVGEAFIGDARISGGEDGDAVVVVLGCGGGCKGGWFGCFNLGRYMRSIYICL